MNTAVPRKAWKYALWSLLALVVLIPVWMLLSGYLLAVVRPDLVESDDVMRRVLVWGIAVPVLAVVAVASWRWSVAQNMAAQNAVVRSGEQSGTRPDEAKPSGSNSHDYVLEVIGLGVTLDKYRQGKLWDALSKGSPYASIREQDPKKYPWAEQDKLGQADGRSGDALENGAKSLPIYFGMPTFTASAPVQNDAYRDTPSNPLVGTAGGEQIGMAFHLFVAAGSQSGERPDEVLNQVFSFFDQHPDVPYVVLTVDDGIRPRSDYSPPSTSRTRDGYYIPSMPDSSALFVLARRERVDAIRAFAFDDINEDKYNGEDLNRYGVARKVMVSYVDLSERVPRPKGQPSRTPTVAEWLQETKALTQREDIYPKHVSLLNGLSEVKYPPRDFKPTPWFPVPWNKDQLAAFDRLPTLGFIHRPVFVKTVDEHGQPLSRRDARAAALAAGWQAALATLPEAERKAAPARVALATGGNVEQTIALTTVLDDWAAHGGRELKRDQPTQWIDTDARLGNTGAATWFMQMAIGVMGSYNEGGASAAINLRDPSEASIIFITPPSEKLRKTQHNAAGGEVWRSIVGPAIDPANYQN